MDPFLLASELVQSRFRLGFELAESSPFLRIITEISLVPQPLLAIVLSMKISMIAIMMIKRIKTVFVRKAKMKGKAFDRKLKCKNRTKQENKLKITCFDMQVRKLVMSTAQYFRSFLE